MFRSPRYRVGAATGIALIAALAWASAGSDARMTVAGVAGAYAALMLVPGLALYLWIEREPKWSEAVASTLVASPVVLAAVAAVALVCGAHVLAAARGLAVVGGALAVAAVLRRGVPAPDLDLRRWIVLGGFIAALCALTAYLPMTDEWWRTRSDAWAHRAYIAEIADFGAPPQDPYFLGFPLQYMWAYHALILTVADAGNFDPFRMMAVLNVQALAGLIVATYLFAAALSDGFARPMASVVTVTLGLNAAFWVFLPLRALKAFTGETRGLDEIAQQFTLSPLTYGSATQFMLIFHNKTFFLDKFMVGTAFGMGLCLMAATWYAATAYLETRRPFLLVFLFVTTLGMLAFHTLVGSAMLAGTLGALGLLFLARHRLDGYRLGDTAKVAASMVAALAVASPYVYSVLHAKDTVGQSSPALFAMRVAGVAISAAFVLVLFAAQRRFFRTRAVAPRFVLLATGVVALYALMVPLPGPNSFDKPVFFLFFPVAVVGAWSLVDLWEKRGVRWAAAVAVLAFVPGNALVLAGCFNTPPDRTITADERSAADWLRAHTARDAVMLDSDDRVPFVTTVPRRHYWGRISFADQWGYDRVEMSRRHHAWRTVYSDRPLDANTLAALGSVDRDLFVVLRGAGAPEVNATRHGEYFERVYTGGTISVLRVDTARCRRDAASGRFPGLSEEEMLRESGLE